MATINQALKGCLSNLEAPYILAVSGGPDSQCLLKSAAHVVGPKNCLAVGINHGLREAAASELELASNLAKSCGVEFRSVTVEVKKGPSIQAQARNARYKALIDVANEVGSRYILTGHNYDDQVETLLIKLLRGTPPKRMVYHNYFKQENIFLIRPLLGHSRLDITKYLKRWGVSYAEDPSNKNSKYLRSWVRNELLPKMEQKSPQIRKHISKYMDVSQRFADDNLSQVEL